MTPTSEVVGVCTCQECKRPYATDMLVPDDVWEVIKPEGSDIGGGLLCPTCIMDRASDRLGWPVGFVYPERHGTAVTAGKSAPTSDVVARLTEHLQLRYMTPSKITGETYQMVPPDLIAEAAALISSLVAERDSWRRVAERCKSEAEGHSMEARTANSTINEIYQVLSGGKGEPGNWNGAEPARQYVATAERLLAEAREALKPWAVIADAVLSEAPHDATRAKLWNGVDNSPLFISLDACRRISATLSTGGVNG